MPRSACPTGAFLYSNRSIAPDSRSKTTWRRVVLVRDDCDGPRAEIANFQRDCYWLHAQRLAVSRNGGLTLGEEAMNVVIEGVSSGKGGG
ncbi:hypothetical protein [Fulvimarina sp. MAC3]|uniref:hypothetical protein n=1 Tax=Fulvimarina sp. MAC3 TaxID=3148887 RepID=UPI0031FD6C8E